MRAVRRGAHAAAGGLEAAEGGGGEGEAAKGGGEGEAASASTRRRTLGTLVASRARARFSATIHLPPRREPSGTSPPTRPFARSGFPRVAVLRLGAASSAASRALEEAARAVVDAGRLAEVLVGEMHAGTNLRSTPDVEDAAIPGRRSVVGADGGVAAAARAPSPRHLGESRGDASVDRVAAVTVRVAAVCGPGSEAETPETRRTGAAVGRRRAVRGLSAACAEGDDARPRSTRAPPTPPHADAAASLADALARVERFAEDEDEGTRG